MMDRAPTAMMEVEKPKGTRRGQTRFFFFALALSRALFLLSSWLLRRKARGEEESRVEGPEEEVLLTLYRSWEGKPRGDSCGGEAEQRKGGTRRWRQQQLPWSFFFYCCQLKLQEFQSGGSLIVGVEDLERLNGKL